MPSPSIARRFLASALILGAGATAHASGIVTTATGAYEEIRFHSPGSTAVSTDVGTPIEGASLCGANVICASGLTFQSSVAGQVTAFGYVESAPSSLTHQDLSRAQAGLGAVSLEGSDQISSDGAVDQGESLTLFFERPTEVVGFVFFDAQNQPFLPSSPAIRLLVDERVYELPAGAASPVSILGTEFTFVGGATSYYLGAVRVAAPVPEASTLLSMGLGLAGVAAIAARRRRAA